MFHRSIIDQLDVYERQGQVLYCQRLRRLLPENEPAPVLAWSDPKHLEMQMAHLLRNISQITTTQDEQNQHVRSLPLQPGGVPKSQAQEDTELIDLVADARATPAQMRRFSLNVQYNRAFQGRVLDRDETYRSARTQTASARAAQLRCAVMGFTELDDGTFFPNDDGINALAREFSKLSTENETRLAANLPLVDTNRESDDFRMRYPAIDQLRSMSIRRHGSPR